jgi:hypothetical protein
MKTEKAMLKAIRPRVCVHIRGGLMYQVAELESGLAALETHSTHAISLEVSYCN